MCFFPLNHTYFESCNHRTPQLGILLLIHLALEQKYSSVLPLLYLYKNYFQGPHRPSPGPQTWACICGGEMPWTDMEAAPSMCLIVSCLLLPTISLTSPLWKMKRWVFLKIEPWTERKGSLANSPEFSSVFQKPGFPQTWNPLLKPWSSWEGNVLPCGYV